MVKQNMSRLDRTLRFIAGVALIQIGRSRYRTVWLWMICKL